MAQDARAATVRYGAFISYSHAASAEVARGLQKWLQALRQTVVALARRQRVPRRNRPDGFASALVDDYRGARSVVALHSAGVAECGSVKVDQARGPVLARRSERGRLGRFPPGRADNKSNGLRRSSSPSRPATSVGTTKPQAGATSTGAEQTPSLINSPVCFAKSHSGSI